MGDTLELEGYFNTHRQANFDKKLNTYKILFVVAPKTQCVVRQVKQMPSGNYGLLVDIKTGKNAGKQVWIYHNLKHPYMRLYKKAQGSVVETQNPPEAHVAIPTAPLPGVGIPSPTPQVLPAPVPGPIEDVTAATEMVANANNNNGSPASSGCEPIRTPPPTSEPTAAVVPNQHAQSTGDEVLDMLRSCVSKEPPYPEATGALGSIEHSYSIGALVCVDRPGGYKYCAEVKGKHGDVCDIKPSIFEFSVEALGDLSGRSATRNYYFNVKSKQDAHLSVDDSVYRDDKNGVEKNSEFYFFPRKVAPAIRNADGKNIITLATGEEAIYDPGKRRFVSGAITEEPMTGINLEHHPRLTYHGNGVLIRINSRSGQSHAPVNYANNEVAITKGGRSCARSVSVADLWEEINGDDVHFRFAEDKDFDQFLMSRCGFSMF